MSACLKISFAVGLRLLLATTIFVFIDFGSSVSDIQGQILGQPEDPVSGLQQASPEFSPLPSTDFEFTPLPFSESEMGKWPSEPTVPTTSPQNSDPTFDSIGMPTFNSLPDYNPSPTNPSPTQNSPPNQSPLSNDYPPKNQDIPIAPYPWINPTAPVVVNNGPVLNRNVIAPANQYVDPASNQFVHPSEMVSSEMFPIGNAYFEAPAGGPGQVVIEQTTLVLPSVPPMLTRPVNQTGDDSGLLSAYQSRSMLQAGEEFQATEPTMFPQGFQPWWSQKNQSPMGLKASPLLVSLDSLIQRALTNSPHIQVAATEPHIQQAGLLEESARFDWLSFLESTYDDQNDPVGNTLTTGNNDSRFQQQQWHAEGGLRRRTRTGGEVEFSQRISTLENNSQFLIPPDQGNSRLVLNYRQPLLRGRGRAVNESLIVLANINLQAASDEFLNEIQQHLTDLTETYWELVRARSELLQRKALLAGAERILAQLEGRSEVDALDRQVFRARSAVAQRKAEIARSVTSIKNAESRIRLLVNDQEIISAASMELVPMDMPNLEHLGINLGDAISTALTNRPDISRSIREVKAASLQLGIARNDVLPKLDLVVGSYVAGLDDEFDILGAFGNQFADGRPGFNVGFEFESPIGNRAARARQSRRVWQANRAMHQYRAIVETGLTEVELAVREVETAHLEMNGRYYAMLAAQKESSFLTDRWETLPEENDSVVLLLENLLDAQERLAEEEAAFSNAQFDYSVAVVKLKQATGILFQVN